MGTKASKFAQIPAADWMPWFLGLQEEQLSADGVRQRIFDADSSTLLNESTSQRWPCGRFSLESVSDLARALSEASQTSMSEARVPLKVKDGIDIGDFQATLRTEDCAMVQIASNFNCVEVPSRSVLPDHGGLVRGYATDRTQGPAASFGVPAASLLRAHYPFHHADMAPGQWGQTEAKQIELLADVREYFGTCVNGKVTLEGAERRVVGAEVDVVASEIKVGIHADAEVVFGRSKTRGALNVLPEPRAVVDQVLSASVNWHSPGCQPADGLDNLTRCALRAAYQGAYLAAIRRGRKNLYLTLIGGGVFGNPEAMILEELAAAHQRWASHPDSRLEQVVVCLYPAGTAGGIQRSLEQLMSGEGKSVETKSTSTDELFGDVAFCAR